MQSIEEEGQAVAIEIVGGEEDRLDLCISRKDTVNRIPIPITARGTQSMMLAHVNKIYGYGYKGDGSIEDKVFRLSKAYIGHALEGLAIREEQTGMEGVIDYITGVLSYLEDMLNRDNGVNATNMLVIDNVFRYLNNHEKIKRLLAIREDQLFNLLNTQKYDSLAEEAEEAGVIEGINWQDIDCQSKGLSVVYHRNGEAVAYYQGKIIGMRLVDGRYKIARKGVPSRITGELDKQFNASNKKQQEELGEDL